MVHHDKTEKPKNPLKEKRFRHNWRTDMLAVPKGRHEELEAFRVVKKDKDKGSEIALQPVPSTPGLKPKKSKKFIPIEQDEKRLTRLKQMTVQPARIYQIQKKIFAKQCGHTFETRMDKKIKIVNQSIYHEYDRARAAMKLRKKLQKQRSAKSKQDSKFKGKGAKSAKSSARSRRKRPHAERLKEALEWCKTAALPKKIYLPPKVDRGKFCSIEEITEHLTNLARARHMYKRPSQDSMNLENRMKVKKNALRYVITDNVAKLAKPSTRIVVEPRPLGQVEPDALTAKPSPRVLELAVPKPKPASNDNDYNEDAFKISPYALKYKPTPRILELAKPKERE